MTYVEKYPATISSEEDAQAQVDTDVKKGKSVEHHMPFPLQSSLVGGM